MYLARGGIKNRIAKDFHDLFCHQLWNVGYVNQPIQAFLEKQSRPTVRWFPLEGKGRFLADPFGIVHDGRTYIFCEELSYPGMKGVISRIEVLDGGDFSPSKAVMDFPYHMSYPFLVEQHGDVYCVPETYQAGEIGLYKADPFPDRWAKVATLVPNFQGVDSTVFPHGGRWWLTCTKKGASNKSLFVFHAPDLFGPWHSHGSNPVKTGLFGTRPAGTPFVWSGSLYRPAMDNSRIYGARIVLNRVKKLSPTEFEEEPAGFVEPSRGPQFGEGIHTLSSAGDITIVDGFRVTFQRTECMIAAKDDQRKFLEWVNPLLHKENALELPDQSQRSLTNR